MVFFDDTGLTDVCMGTPKIVLEVQRSSGDRTRMLKGVAKSGAGLSGTIFQEGLATLVELVEFKRGSGW